MVFPGLDIPLWNANCLDDDQPKTPPNTGGLVVDGDWNICVDDRKSASGLEASRKVLHVVHCSGNPHFADVIFLHVAGTRSGGQNWIAHAERYVPGDLCI